MFMETLCRVMVVGCILGFGSHVLAIDEAAGGETMKVSEGPALPVGRASHAGGAVGGRVVIAGGTRWSADRQTKYWLDDSLVFTDGAWLPGPPLPHAVSEPMFASDGASLYVAGGRRGAAETNDGVYRLSETDGKLAWATLPKLPLTLTAGAGAIVDGQLIVTCGATNDGPTTQTWALDVTRDKAEWRERKPAPGPARMYPALVACGKFLYLFGGVRPTEEQGAGGMEVFKDAYRYDPRADAWERLADLPAKGYCWGAGAIDDGSVLLAGRADGTIHDEVWRVSVKDMRVQRVGRTVIQAACAPLVRAADDAWWLIGGEPDALKTRTEKVTVIQRGAP